MRSTRRYPTPGRGLQRGITMIEVLVTVIVLAIGLLGLAGLQLNSLRFTHSAYQNSQATVMANDILDRMRANRTAAEAGSYTITMGTAPGAVSCEGAGAECAPVTMAAADLFEWKEALAATLPDGDGAIAWDGAVFTITIQWDDSRGELAPKALILETLL